MDGLHARVDALAEETGFSGVVRLDLDGRTELAAAYGLADRAHRIPMTVDTRLAVASGSKTFTALVMMALVEQGRLALDTAAREWLGSDLPLVGDDVTVEHLLAHRSGIGDYMAEDEEAIEDYPMPVSVHRLARTEDFLPLLDGHPTAFPAGERFSYCSAGYVVLALLAERATGRGYHDLVRDLVTEPAGMADTDFLRSDGLPGDAAIGWVEVDGQWRTNVFHLPVLGTGDGGAYTTLADVHRFWEALDAGRIVSPGTVAEMTRVRSVLEPAEDDEADGVDGTAGDAPPGYGLGFWLPTGRDLGQVALEGCDAGVSFSSVHDPAIRSTYTVISTTTRGAWPFVDLLDPALGRHPG
jgi:CubicO group peptidase (beta-lactamase class C family)